MRLQAVKYFKTVILISALGSCMVFAQEVYEIKKGNVLSKVVQERFPQERIYGTKGKLTEVLKLNPEITDGNLIFPNQKVILSDIADKNTESKMETTVPPVSSPNSVELAPPVEAMSPVATAPTQWSLSALYGSTYYSLEQKGAQGSAEIGENSFDDYQLMFSAVHAAFSWGLEFGKDHFKHSQSISSKPIAFQRWGAWISKGLYVLRLDQEQYPIFRNNGVNIENSLVEARFASAGLTKSIELSADVPTNLRLEFLLGVPISSHGENPLSTQNIKGYRAAGVVQIDRLLYRTSKISLFGVGRLDGRALRVSHETQWSVSSGTVESSIDTLRASLGIRLQF